MRWTVLSAVASGLVHASLLAGIAAAKDRPDVQQSQPKAANSQATASKTAALTSATRALETDQPLDNRSDAPHVEPGLESGLADCCRTGNFCGDLWSCCACWCESGLYAGLEATFLAPVDEPEQRVVLTDLVTGEQFVGESDPGLGSGVRTWVGLQRCGWGFRATYWHFGDDHIEVEPAVPIKGQPAFTQAYHLDADVLDVELTQTMCFHCWNVYASFGGRHVDLERNATVVGFGTVGNGVDVLGLAVGANEIEGSGFTFSVGATRPLGCFCGWHLFWNFRGSFLWADSVASVLTEANAVTVQPIGSASANSRDKAFAGKDHAEDVFIGEVQLGLQYQHCLCCLPATLFFRAVVEYQHWNTGDVSAQSGSFAFLQGGPPPFGGRVDASASGHDGDLDLIGVSISAGLTY